MRNVEYTLIVGPECVILLPLPIKLGIMRNFEKALAQNNDDLIYLKQKYIKLDQKHLHTFEKKGGNLLCS
jgi:hypothetical protein